MFGLFTNQNRIKVIDKVWMSSSAKWKACAEMAKLDPNCLFIAWFEVTLQQLNDLLANDKANILSASEAGPQYVQGRVVVFAEHYPLPKVEQELYQRLGIKEIPVLSSLDEPFFMKFGGEKTIELMKKLGMGENDVIGHSLITKSIRKAQEKIAERATSDIQSSSQHEWFERNLR